MTRNVFKTAASLSLALAAFSAPAYAQDPERGTEAYESIGGEAARTRRQCNSALSRATTQFLNYGSRDIGFIVSPTFACKVDLNTRVLITTYNLASVPGMRALYKETQNPGQPPRPQLDPHKTPDEKCRAASMKRQPLAYNFPQQYTGFHQGADFACKLDLRHYRLVKSYDLQNPQDRTAYSNAVRETDQAGLAAQRRAYEDVKGRPPLFQRRPLPGADLPPHLR